MLPVPTSYARIFRLFDLGFWKCISSPSLLSFLVPVLRWVQRHVFFPKSSFLIAGLVFSRSFVEHRVMAVLITYLTDNWTEQNLMKSAAIVNAQEGISGILGMVLAFVADKFTGRLKMVILTTIAYIIGLMLLSMHAGFLTPRMAVLFFILASLFTAVGQAGESFLRDFLEDQVSTGTKNIIDGHVNEDVTEARANFCWRVAWVLGASFALLYTIFGHSWFEAFMLCSSLMILFFIFFLFGLKIYEDKQPFQSPIVTICKAIKAKWQRRRSRTCYCPIERMRISRHRLAESRNRRACTIEEEDEVKRFFTLFPVLFSFFIYTLVDAAGSTFFIEQVSNMDSHVGNFEVPIVSLYILQKSSKRVASFIVGKIIVSCKCCCSVYPNIVRIGAGMVFSSVCVLVAYIVEEKRLQMVWKYDILSHPDDIIPMSIFVLVPQFFLLGLMEAHAKDGLNDLIRTYMETEGMKQYSEPLVNWMLGFGKPFSILVVYPLRGWFKGSVNASRLDKYYRFLAILSFLNIFLYKLIMVPAFVIAKGFITSKIKKRLANSCKRHVEESSHMSTTTCAISNVCLDWKLRGHNSSNIMFYVLNSFMYFLLMMKLF